MVHQLNFKLKNLANKWSKTKAELSFRIKTSDQKKVPFQNPVCSMNNSHYPIWLFIGFEPINWWSLERWTSKLEAFKKKLCYGRW